MLGNATGNDAAIVRQIGIDVEAYPMKADPAPDAYADCRNLVLRSFDRIAARHSHAHPIGAALTLDAELT